MAKGGGAAVTGASPATVDTGRGPQVAPSHPLIAIPIDTGVDILHPSTTARRVYALITGATPPPQYGGVGVGRNAGAMANIPDLSPGYVAEQKAFVSHDVGMTAAGGNFMALTSRPVQVAHAQLAKDSSNLGIKVLFGGLATVGFALNKLGVGTVATGGGAATTGAGTAGGSTTATRPGTVVIGGHTHSATFAAQLELADALQKLPLPAPTGMANAAPVPALTPAQVQALQTAGLPLPGASAPPPSTTSGLQAGGGAPNLANSDVMQAPTGQPSVAAPGGGTGGGTADQIPVGPVQTTPDPNFVPIGPVFIPPSGTIEGPQTLTFNKPAATNTKKDDLILRGRY